MAQKPPWRPPSTAQTASPCCAFSAVLSITTKSAPEIVADVDQVAAELHDFRDEYVTLASNASGETAAHYEGIAQGFEVALSLVLSALGVEVGA